MTDLTPIPSAGYRPTEEEINAIIEVDSTVSDLTPFLTAAHMIVEAHCEGIEETDATIVETWLTAHLITIRDNRAAAEKVDVLSINYQYKLELGLQCSMYGQQAMMMDPTGGLAAWNRLILSGKAARTPGIHWLGTQPDDWRGEDVAT